MTESRRYGLVYGTCADLPCKFEHRRTHVPCPFKCPKYKRRKEKNWKRKPERYRWKPLATSK